VCYLAHDQYHNTHTHKNIYETRKIFSSKKCVTGVKKSRYLWYTSRFIKRDSDFTFFELNLFFSKGEEKEKGAGNDGAEEESGR
jgi:hypothetical protein